MHNYFQELHHIHLKLDIKRILELHIKINMQDMHALLDEDDLYSRTVFFSPAYKLLSIYWTYVQPLAPSSVTKGNFTWFYYVFNTQKKVKWKTYEKLIIRVIFTTGLERTSKGHLVYHPVPHQITCSLSGLLSQNSSERSSIVSLAMVIPSCSSLYLKHGSSSLNLTIFEYIHYFVLAAVGIANWFLSCL